MNIDPYKTGFSNICDTCDHVHYTLFVQERLANAYCMGVPGCPCTGYVATPTPRPSWDEFFFDMARLVSTRATCPRASIGAVLVKFKRVIGTGYNGADENLPHCPSSGPALVTHLALEHCLEARHAERNALKNSWIPPIGATLYVIGPRLICDDCSEELTKAQVTDIRWKVA